MTARRPSPSASCRLSDPPDAVVATYREHGQALARGVPANAIMAEMLRQARRMLPRPWRFDAHFRPTSAGSMAATRSSAEACRWRSASRSPIRRCARRAVTACFFGNGAVDEGEFHETLNLAALWKLPVLFVCENNLYAMGMAIERAEAETDIARKAAASRIARRTGRRHGRHRRGSRRPTRGRLDPGARRALFPGMPDLSVPGAFHVRRAALPAEGGGGGLAQQGIHRPLSQMAARTISSSPARILPRSSRRSTREIAAAVAFAEAGTLEPLGDLELFAVMEAVPQ